MLCHVDFSLESSTWSCGDTMVAGAAHMRGCAALTSEHWHWLGTFLQGQIPKFLTEFTQQRWGGWCCWQNRHPRHEALPQSPWLKALFAASSDNRNLRLLIHYETKGIVCIFIRRLDTTRGMQIPCDEEKKIPGLWRCKSWQIMRHYGIIPHFFCKLRKNNC